MACDNLLSEPDKSVVITWPVCKIRRKPMLNKPLVEPPVALRMTMGLEKDYVLGWLLWGIQNHDALAENWIFKGGTCLKKCFFETYRFSEDLDFTLTDSAHIDADFLKSTFAEIGARILEETGIECSAEYQRFEIYKNPHGHACVQGRIGYRGPLSPRGHNVPRIKLDLTIDERVVLSPVQSPVFHPYSDYPADGILIWSYPYEEAFAEKIRALGERTRPRDLYDVINLYRNEYARPAPDRLHEILAQKCAFKGVEVPTIEAEVASVRRTTWRQF